MLDLKNTLKSRLLMFEMIAKQGQIPGVIDSLELMKMKGHIEELSFTLELLLEFENDIML